MHCRCLYLICVLELKFRVAPILYYFQLGKTESSRSTKWISETGVKLSIKNPKHGSRSQRPYGPRTPNDAINLLSTNTWCHLTSVSHIWRFWETRLGGLRLFIRAASTLIEFYTRIILSGTQKFSSLAQLILRCVP